MMGSQSQQDESGPLYSMEEIDAVLQAEYGQFSPYQGADVVWFDPKKKLQLFAATAYLEDKLEKASPEEVRAMVNRGLFKGLCSMMAIAPDESEEANAVMSVSTTRLTSFVEALPDLAAKAWSYGAVRPITDVVKRKRDLANPDFLKNDALKAALEFLEAMGKPLHENDWGRPSPPSDAKRTAGKLYKWLLKEGVIDAVVEIWGALPNFGEEFIETTNYEELASSGASVLWYASIVHCESLVMATKDQLLKPVIHFLMAEASDFQGIRQVALALLYNLWLNDMNDYSKVPDAEKIRGRIARRSDIQKVLALLGEYSEDPDKEPRLSKTLSLIRGTFVGLLRLLSTVPSIRPSRQALQTACHLSAAVEDPRLCRLDLELVSVFANTGKLTSDNLLAHAFPGLLRGFAAEVARRYPATCQPPEFDVLKSMLGFLLCACGRAFQKVCADRGEPVERDYTNVGLAMPPGKVQNLVRLMLETRAAAALAALSSSRYCLSSDVVVRSDAEAARDDGATLKALLEQMLPALVLGILEEGADRARCRQSLILLRLVAQLNPTAPEVRFGTFPADLDKRLHEVGLLERPGMFAKYIFEGNKLYMDEALVKERGDMLLGFIKEMQSGPFRMGAEDSARLQREYDLDELRSRTGCAAVCCVCGKELETLKRCARCRQAEYCGAECQAKDWPRHKKMCKSK